MQLSTLAHLIRAQEGVITRAQLLCGGAGRHDIRRWLSRNEIRQLLPGVYVTHTGAPTWRQRAWAAVLSAEPAALAGVSALRVAPGRRLSQSILWQEGDPVDLLVGRGRHPALPTWVKVHRRDDIDVQVDWVASPPRQRLEDAALDVVVTHLRSGHRDAHLHATAALADPIQSARTTAPRMLQALDRRPRIRNRSWIRDVILDVAAGSTTVLEQGFTRNVQRPHGLPQGLRQVHERQAAGSVARDVLLLGRQIIELDGRAFHQGARARNADLDRDLDAAVAGMGSVRLGWGQVFDQPCVTAAKIALLLVAQGWTGSPHACRPGCPVTTIQLPIPIRHS